MSYTKGEWKRARKTIMLDQGGCFKCTVTSDSKEDPVNPCAGYGLTNVEAMANAQLIAAAPDMLEALEHVLMASEDDGSMEDIDFEMVRQALANAKGKETP